MRGKKIVYMLAAIILVVSISMTIGLKANAKNPTRPDGTYKYYCSVEVQSGDSLWSIASEYADTRYVGINEYIEEVRKMNNMTSDEIKTGTFLTVYYYSNEYKE